MRLRLAPLAACVVMASCSTTPPPPPKVQPAAPARILQFYAGSGEVAAGESVTICYGVEDATSVRIEPPVEQLRPALSRCFSVSPRRDTAYRLIAEGADGKTVSGVFTVKVRAQAGAGPQESLVSIFTASSEVIAPGRPVTLCYIAHGATELKLEPGEFTTPPGRHCVAVRPAATTTYTLTATGSGGRTEARRITVTVR